MTALSSTFVFWVPKGSFSLIAADTRAHILSRVLLIAVGICTHKIAQNTRSERFPKSAAGPFEIPRWSIDNVSFIVEFVCVNKKEQANCISASLGNIWVWGTSFSIRLWEQL